MMGHNFYLRAQCATIRKILRFIVIAYTVLLVFSWIMTIITIFSPRKGYYKLDTSNSKASIVYQIGNPNTGTSASTGVEIPSSVSTSAISENPRMAYYLFSLENALKNVFMILQLHLLWLVFWEIDQQGTPFTAYSVDCIRKIAWMMLIGNLLKTIFFPLVYDLILGSGSVTLDVGTWFWCGVIFCVATVFEYGESLEQQVHCEL